MLDFIFGPIADCINVKIFVPRLMWTAPPSGGMRETIRESTGQWPYIINNISGDYNKRAKSKNLINLRCNVGSGSMTNTTSK